ncbi:hypothetical protein [Mucilaginibacter ginkgonis]|uniref:Uncharacterized protein n=1 Tax=Mucilaginibacter ginkgonis TaxID=2682091 RepID=A0A6I4IN42_9SPHI|nr:hypothetical protein [Mucilaginibacter ginkgonis]QQL49279.1 hypothetical protein GO620_014020 [Mucilaginibacter ginkgonis]
MAGKQMQLSAAQKMVSDYNEACNDGDIHSLLIDAQYLQNIISQKDCKSVRFFIALENGLPKGPVGLAQGHTLVLVGVDADGKNIKRGEDDTQVYEELAPCPPQCGGGDDGSIL